MAAIALHTACVNPHCTCGHSWQYHVHVQTSWVCVGELSRLYHVCVGMFLMATCCVAQIYRLSIWNGRASPGSELMNLRYRNERAMSHSMASTSSSAAASHQGGGRTGIEGPGLTTAQRVLFGMGDVLVPYSWAKLNRRASQQEWLDR